MSGVCAWASLAFSGVVSQWSTMAWELIPQLLVSHKCMYRTSLVHKWLQGALSLSEYSEAWAACVRVGWPSCNRTAPRPLSGASHCSVRHFVKTKYGALVTNCYAYPTSGGVSFWKGSHTLLRRGRNFQVIGESNEPAYTGHISWGWHLRDSYDLCYICFLKTVLQDQMIQEGNFFTPQFHFVLVQLHILLTRSLH